MKTEEDEAFDDLAKRQGSWGGGFTAKRKMAADKMQEPSITRPCRSCNGTGDRDTGIAESPIATCKPCNGTGQIALAQPAQRQWIWLSDADIAEVVDTTCQYSGGYEEYLIKKAERKIKELNT